MQELTTKKLLKEFIDFNKQKYLLNLRWTIFVFLFITSILVSLAMQHDTKPEFYVLILCFYLSV
jgi:hypothetical protein